MDALLAALFALLQPLLACARPRTLLLNGRSLRVTGRPLGEGATATVHLVRDASGAEYACKELLQTSAEAAAREVAAHRACGGSPFVLPLIDAGSGGGAGSSSGGGGEVGVNGRSLLAGGDGSDTSAMLLLFPVCRAGSLQDAITAAVQQRGGAGGGGAPATPTYIGEGLSERVALIACASVARGLAALHATGRSHRDVCPRNIMLMDQPHRRASATEHGATPPRPWMPWSAVLGDLGSVAPLIVPIPTRREAAVVEEDASQFSSPPYRAPELWSCEAGPSPLDGAATDVWSLGCTLYACLVGVSPYECARMGTELRLVEPCLSRTLGDVHWPRTPPISRGVQDLVTAMLSRDPLLRPSIHAIITRAEELASP